MAELRIGDFPAGPSGGRLVQVIWRAGVGAAADATKTEQLIAELQEPSP